MNLYRNVYINFVLSKGRSESFQPADEPIYQDPAEDEAALYEQYQRINVTYIQKDHIRYRYLLYMHMHTQSLL